jgi:hypothetical protein
MMDESSNNWVRKKEETNHVIDPTSRFSFLYFLMPSLLVKK